MPVPRVNYWLLAAMFFIGGDAFGNTYTDFIQRLGSQRSNSDRNQVVDGQRADQPGRDADRPMYAALYRAVQKIELSPREAIGDLEATRLIAAPTDPLFPIINYYQAVALLGAGQLPRSRALLYSLFSDDNLGSAWQQAVAEKLLLVLYKQGSLKDFAEIYERYSGRTEAKFRDELTMQLAAEIYSKLNMPTRERETLEELAGRYPTSEGSRWAFRRLLELSCSIVSENPYYFSYQLLTSLGRNVSLGNGLEEFLRAAASGIMINADGQVGTLSLIDQVQFLFDARLYPLARERANEFLKGERDTYSPEYRRAVLLLARISTRMRDVEGGSRYFSYFNFKYPNHIEGSRIQEFIADSLRYGENYSSAAVAYRALTQQKPSPALKWNHFWSVYRSGSDHEAIQLLLTDGYITVRDAVAPGARAYWLGRIYERLGDTERSRNTYRELLKTTGDSYYANLVVAKYPDLGNGGGLANIDREVPAGPDLPSTVLARQGILQQVDPSLEELNPRAKMILTLLDFGLNEAAQMEIRSISQRRGGDPIEFAIQDQIANRMDDYHLNRSSSYRPLASFLSRSNSWDSMTSHQLENDMVWKAFYPLPYRAVVESVAGRLAMDSYLIWSVMRAESSYNPTAVSPVGARGLLQVMPYTAVKIGRRLAGSEIKSEQLLRPEFNIGLGAWYIKYLLNYYSDNIVLAVAAYNAGPQAVNAWIDRCRQCQLDEFVESIPFDETRNYVKKIFVSYSRYHRIYEKNPVFSSLPSIPNSRPATEDLF